MKRNLIAGEWYKQFETIDFENLEATHYWYARIRTDDFYNFIERGENAAENREIIFSAMLDLQIEWKKQLDSKAYEYRLETWLLWPEFLESQVVASIEERITRYEKLYSPVEPALPFPAAFCKNISNKVNAFNWTYSEDFQTYWESYYTDREPMRQIDPEGYAADMAHYESLLVLNQYQLRADENGNIDKLFYVKVNDVWVGQLPR